MIAQLLLVAAWALAQAPPAVLSITMTVTNAPVWFTPQMLGYATWALVPDNAGCKGRIHTDGIIRYGVNGKTPSQTFGGTLAPGPLYPPTGPPLDTAEGTWDGNEILLWDKRLVHGFKAISAVDGKTGIEWTCDPTGATIF